MSEDVGTSENLVGREDGTWNKPRKMKRLSVNENGWECMDRRKWVKKSVHFRDGHGWTPGERVGFGLAPCKASGNGPYGGVVESVGQFSSFQQPLLLHSRAQLTGSPSVAQARNLSTILAPSSSPIMPYWHHVNSTYGMSLNLSLPTISTFLGSHCVVSHLVHCKSHPTRFLTAALCSRLPSTLWPRGLPQCLSQHPLF